MWGWVKKWFDPITTSKIFILGANDVKSTLSAFIDVANIPKKYGGELDFECGMLPVLDAPILKVLSLSSPEKASAAPMFLAAPVRWVDGDNGDLIALGVGSNDGKPHREIVATLHAHAAQNAFPGMSRQNTRNAIEPIASREVVEKAVPAAVPPRSVTDQSISAPAPVQPHSHLVQPGPISIQAPSATGQHASATFPPPPVHLQPGPVRNGIENPQPGRISLPPQATAPQFQRSGTEYFTPPIDVSELKRL